MMGAVTGVTSVSEREAEVLAAVGEHLTNAEIAARLHISIRTVESHVSSLLRKLGLPDRRALAALGAHPEPQGGSPSGGPAGRGLLPRLSPRPSGWQSGLPSPSRKRSRSGSGGAAANS
jgi:DNA-binding CsgD family transcriptional regulator